MGWFLGGIDLYFDMKAVKGCREYGGEETGLSDFEPLPDQTLHA